jgi:hypothetical protein
MRMTDLRRGYALGAALGLTLAIGLAGCNSGSSGSGSTGSGSGSGRTLSVAEPASGATVTVPFTVKVNSSVPLGATNTGLHHVHVWFDDNSKDYLVVESDTTQVTNLSAGQHVMHVSLRNANHTRAGTDTETTITVGGTGGTPSPTTRPDY